MALMPTPPINDPVRLCTKCNRSFKRSDNHHHGPTQDDRPAPKEK